MVMKENYIFVQPTLSSSWNGYGTSTLMQDVFEIDDLLSSTQQMKEMTDLGKVVIIGHSTGCQDAVYYMKNGKYKNKVRSIVLQAPVSDREAIQLDAKENGLEDDLAKAIKFASDAISSGNGKTTLMRRDTPGTYGVPMTAERYASLTGRMTSEDMFSTDLTDEELIAQLGHLKSLNVLTCWVLSGKDQYIPASLSKNYSEFGQKLSDVTNGDYYVIENGDHGLSHSTDYNEFINIVKSILKSGLN
jgi:pimeloyl-ACP methyl ester carboxylesterase